MKYLLSLVIFCNFIFSNEMNRIDMVFDNEPRHYLVFKPDNDSKPKNLVIGIHGYTGSATGFEKETTGGFNESAEKYNFIAVYPQGLYFYEDQYFGRFMRKNYVSSWNDLTASKTKTPTGETCAVDAVPYPKYSNCKGTDAGRCAWSSCGNDIGFLKKIIDDVKNNYDVENIYVLGVSNGGKIAHALACEFPKLLTGVMNVIGSPALGLACKPKGPINYVVYGGLKDDTVPPIDIVSWDKYFYTPIDTIANDWKSLFNCKEMNTFLYDEYDSIKETVYSSCNDGVKVTSILNMDRGHTYPGVNDDNSGYCKTNIQDEILINECRSNINIWGNDFVLERLLN